MLLGVIVIVGVLIVRGNLLADILYDWADPRIKHDWTADPCQLV